MDQKKIADELAIRNLYAAYTFSVDNHDGDGFVNCFTPDARIKATSFELIRTMMAAGQAPFINAEGWIVGSKNIRAMHAIVPPTVITHHLTNNIEFKSLEGDRAEARAAFTVFADDGIVEHFGHYIDKIARCPDGRWRFSERQDVARYERKRSAFGL